MFSAQFSAFSASVLLRLASISANYQDALYPSPFGLEEVFTSDDLTLLAYGYSMCVEVYFLLDVSPRVATNADIAFIAIPLAILPDTRVHSTLCARLLKIVLPTLPAIAEEGRDRSSCPLPNSHPNLYELDVAVAGVSVKAIGAYRRIKLALPHDIWLLAPYHIDRNPAVLDIRSLASRWTIWTRLRLNGKVVVAVWAFLSGIDVTPPLFVIPTHSACLDLLCSISPDSFSRFWYLPLLPQLIQAYPGYWLTSCGSRISEFTGGVIDGVTRGATAILGL
ncbi:hypothetical protein NMY22_g10655 [Coprinellus aureogranulatus]|nr:hypothetical protein NMY22_g10655 [Coprinellus aureogranulatus]